MVKDLDPSEYPPCYHMTEVFFAQEEDGRTERGRKEREDSCKELCFTCPYEIGCLWRAVRQGEYYGVWGGTGEADRREFVQFMRDEGYDSVPTLEEFDEFKALWFQFWQQRGSPRTMKEAPSQETSD